MKKLCLLLSFLILFQTLAFADDYIAAVDTKDNGSPYYIMVNRAQNTVTVYSLDENGYYTVPERAFICSCGRSGHATPLGTFSIYGEKMAWHLMNDSSYGQYVCRFNGHILFHSVCYKKTDPASLITEEYNALGGFASLGCVRLQVIDAKWIYDNCPIGTKVTVYDGTAPGALGKPSRTVEYISPEFDNGWEPTDPRGENPWSEILAFFGVSPSAKYLHLPLRFQWEKREPTYEEMGL